MFYMLFLKDKYQNGHDIYRYIRNFKIRRYS